MVDTEVTDLEEDIEDIILESRIPLSSSDLKLKKPDISNRSLYKHLERTLNRGFVDYVEVEVGTRKVKFYKKKEK